ncbi:MAG: Gfo/Idh/MocA family oxidoreductase [Planctomycetaceae bacterium]|nr:Gfo/Idh/MocA family oxidoreductase [Planctomycetaceae bacterium]
MPQPARRQFLQSTLAAASVSAFAGTTRAATDEKSVMKIALIGCGGMGGNHLRLLSARKDVVVSWVCDVDQERLAAAVKTVEENSSTTPKSTNDLRKVLDDQSIEAVFIATPDHWHTPAALLALDAGKHVYVEKPCCHNVREGRLLADAVKRTGRRLQVGTQSRSTDCVRDGIERIRRGDIGEILVAKAWNSQKRGSIGKSEPGTPPAHLDFDTWLGPAQVTQWRPNLLHGVWRWWYNFGCGDIGNDGVHDIDVAVWGLGVETHPSRVACFGGKTFFDDDQQFPDTQYAICEYPVDGAPAGRCKQLIFEQRIWSPYVQEGYENGAAFYGTQGQLVMGHSVGWRLYGPKNKLIAERSGGGDVAAHHQNFFDCIRDPSKSINASVDAGRWSATIVHLANIAARTDSILHFDPQTERIIGNDKADAMLTRQYREHWGAPKS